MPALALFNEIPENKEKEGLGQGERNQEKVVGVDVQHFGFLWPLVQAARKASERAPGWKSSSFPAKTRGGKDGVVEV